MKNKLGCILTAGSMRVARCSNDKKFAFTLAEVLITLGIIGVVAAMTLPVLIGNYQKKATVAKLQKAYTILNQALKQSELDNGDYQYWDSTDSMMPLDYVQKYWQPYFKETKLCKTSSECGYDKEYPWSLSNGGRCTFTVAREDLRTGILTSDGILYAISIRQGDDSGDSTVPNKLIIVDINGPVRPNVVGKDVFAFDRTENGIKPQYYTLSGSYVNSNCSKNGSGFACAAKIMKDGWQIKSDYPW